MLLRVRLYQAIVTEELTPFGRTSRRLNGHTRGSGWQDSGLGEIPFVNQRPSWIIYVEKPSLTSTCGSPAGPNEWKVMLQNLLVDRFHLAFHRETKELPIYALVLARKDGKLGPRMIESKEGGCAVRDPLKPMGPPGPGGTWRRGL
jgi:hypothetical protein